MFTTQSKVILVITGLTHFAVHASMIIFPAIMGNLKVEFGVDLAALGWVYMLSNFMFGLGAIPAGWIEGKVGGKVLLIVYQFGAAVAALWAALAPDLLTLTGALVLLGVSSSIYHPAGLTLVSRHVRQTSRAMGYHGIAGSAGLALGPVLAAWFGAQMSWRWAYGAVAIFCLLLAAATAIVIPSKKQTAGEVDVMRTPTTKIRPLIVYYAVVVLVGLTFYGFKTYMPTHFSENSGALLKNWDSGMRGGFFTTIVLIAGILGQFLGGRLGDKHSRTALLPWIFALQVFLLVSFGLNDGWSVLLSGVLLGLVHFSFQPVGNSLIAQYTTSASRGMGYGVSFFLSFGLGSFAAGFGGNIAVRTEVAMVFPFVAIFMVFAFLLALYLKRVSQ